MIILYTGTDRHGYEVGLVSPPLVSDLGGRLSGGPGVVFVPAGSLGPDTGIFGRGTDNALYRFTGNRMGFVRWAPDIQARRGRMRPVGERR